MNIEKIKEIETLLEKAIKDLDGMYFHHQDGSDLRVNEQEQFNIIFNKVICSQPYKPASKGLSKALILLNELC